MCESEGSFRNPEDHKIKVIRVPVFIGDENLTRSKVNSSASWILWIIAISMVNTIMGAFGSDMYFNLGLGITFVIDTLINAGIKGNTDNGFVTFVRIVGCVIDMTIYSVFIGLWYLTCRKFYKWSLLFAAILFTLDGVIFVVLGVFIPVIIHVMAVMYMMMGLSAFADIRIEKRTLVVSS